MPLFNDLKRIFFGAKSVAKHQAGRAGDAARDAAEELSARAPEFIEKGKDALTELGDAVYKHVAPETRQRDRALEDIDDHLDFGDLNLSPEEDAPKSGSIDFEADLETSPPPTPPREPSAFAQAADAGLDAAARAGLKAKAAAEAAGEELLDRAARTGAKLKGHADDFIDHANREAEKMRLEDSIEDAKRAAAQAEARARAFENREHERATDKSTLSGTDSFFERADRFARGDYHNEGGKDLQVRDDPDFRPRKKSDLIAGFTDNDNDGDSLIDDAIVEEE